MNDGEGEELFEGVEVAVAVKERVTVAEAESGDEAVDCFADRVAAAAEKPEIFRGVDGELFAAGLEDGEFAKIAQNAREGFVVANALEDLA